MNARISPKPLCLALSLALPLLAAPSLAFAADDDKKVTELPVVTVSASPLQTPSQDLLTPNNVLQGEALMLKRNTSIGETLSGEPGISTSHFGTTASRPIIRGMDAARVRLLSDGAEVQDASTISPDHATAVDTMLATRIEILRGPSALAYGAGALGGVINVLDDRVPTAIPEKGVEGSVEVRAGTAARENATSAAVTAGAGNFALHVEGLNNHAGNYTAGKDRPGGDRVNGTDSRGHSGSVGASWIGDRGYLGLAFSSQHRNYGLPGQSEVLAECTAEGNSLSCPETSDEGDDGAVPHVVMRTERWDVRGELSNPFAGFTRARLRAGLSDYRHDEVENGEVDTTFRNKAHNARLELEHLPIAGWRGAIGGETSRRRFSAIGGDAYVQPTDTRRQALFVQEARDLGSLRFEIAGRQEWQRIAIESDQGNRDHTGTSVSTGAIWKFADNWQIGSTYTLAQRLPTAEELYANGLHLASGTWERGNANLHPETSNNLDLSLRKTAGDTTMKLGIYQNRIHNYIYARTLDELDGLQLIEYSQRDAVFTGFEGEIRQALNRNYGVSLLGDYVRAKLSHSESAPNLPRIPAARVGLRADMQQASLRAQAEIFRVSSQRRVAEHESSTPGYTLINVGASYGMLVGNLDMQLYARLDNLTNQLARVHTSFIKDAAPLTGRNLVVGMRTSF